MSKFQIYNDYSGKFRFRLIAENNQIAAMGEAYEQHASCINGIRSIQNNCSAEIEDLTIKDRKMLNPKYQIYKDKTEKFRFRLKAPNGEIIAEGEEYESKEGCLNGIAVVRSSCDAEIEDLPVKNKTIQEDVVPPKIEEPTLTPKTKPEAASGAQTVKDEEVAPTKIETPRAPSTADIILLEPEEMEEWIQTVPITMTKSTPKSKLPTETTLELYPSPEKMNVGEFVILKGKLSEGDSGKGISNAKIIIYEHDTSVLGYAYLARGVTGEDGSFNIAWKAKHLTWRKNTGRIYAEFFGNERVKPSRSSIQSVIIN